MRRTDLVIAALACLVSTVAFVAAAETDRTEPSVERGRYLAIIGGCNDCHTPGYPEAGGNIPEAQWLTGVPVGFRGPWGTTYPANLRLHMSGMSEDEWVEAAKHLQTRPPMPWFAVQAMSDTDLRSLHRLVVSLGPAGEKMPDAVPPGQEPSTPFIPLVTHSAGESGTQASNP